MNILIESHIKRKLNLLNTLYFRERPISLVELASILGISENTLKGDLQKYDLLGTKGEIDIAIDKDRRLELYYTFMQESIIVKIFRILLREPGKKAQYYSNALSISRTYFYKVVLALNNELEKYKARISVNTGYHIIAEDERMFRLYAFFYFSTTYTEQDPIQNQRYRVFLELLKMNHIDYPLLEQIEFWDDNYHTSLLLINIIRQSDNNSALPIPDFHSYRKSITIPEQEYNTIRSLYPHATRQSITEALILFARFKDSGYLDVEPDDVNDILLNYSQMTGLELNENQMEQIVTRCTQILSMTLYVSKNFPFNVNHFSIIMKDFYCEYAIINADLLDNFNKFLELASQTIQNDFSKIRVLVFYLMITNIGDYLFAPKKKILFASKRGMMHLEHSKNELEIMLRMVKINPDITMIPLTELRREAQNGTYDLIFSESKLDGLDNVLLVVFNNSLLMLELVLKTFRSDYKTQLELLEGE